MKISICGPLGLETAKNLVKENGEKVEKRFAPFFLEQFEAIREVSAPEGAYVWEVQNGGLYRTLWQAGESLNCGMEIYEESIPIRQEVIEILELFGESPYETPSRGCFIIASEDEPEAAVVIGKTTKKKARLLIEKGFERYLTPPGRQERDIKDRKSYC